MILNSTKKMLSPAAIWVLLLTLLIPGVVSAQGAKRNMSAQPDGLYAAITTSKGEILLSLDFKKTPMTVMNFVGLAEGKLNTSTKKGQPFYDGLNFHRVIADFMIQGGDPRGNGTGDPGYKFPDEFDSSLKFDKPGYLAMANSGPDTNGSQFFITHVPTPWLNGKHTIFGQVVSGQDVVNKVQQGDKIVKVEIIRKGAAAEAFQASQSAFDAAIKAQGDKNKKAAADANKAQIDKAAKYLPNATKTASGIFYVVDKTGSGSKPTRGQTVSVHYTGKLLDGTVFDSSVQRNEPIEIAIGVGQVIAGWDEIVMDMKIGEKRRIVLPPELAYGSRGAGGVIPPNAYLYFEVELLSAK